MNDFEPDVRGAVMVFIIIIIGLVIIMIVGTSLLAEKYNTTEEVVSPEGVAKAHMIKELTGYEFPPDVAKWANINFSGTTVSVETHKIDIWDLQGKQE